MGKWKYVNWLITLAVLMHMYRYFFVRYEAPTSIYILATVGWFVVGALAYYVFVFKMRQSDRLKRPPVVEAQVQKATPRERPKVVFRKKGDDSK
jgi:hypothetical protein